ncbi:unnamed protein product [Coffea canephora]|uniref:Uncharacterized protein n=1 Tax=Coffea canephora TaxID=49390 RepID=A0A068UL88_COFCA|nr:unnamed protein product [Coffea canephora]
MMKEILLCKVNFKNEILLVSFNSTNLNDCGYGRKYCRENAAYIVKN